MEKVHLKQGVRLQLKNESNNANISSFNWI